MNKEDDHFCLVIFCSVYLQKMSINLYQKKVYFCSPKNEGYFYR